jgi:hypothetical protein
VAEDTPDAEDAAWRKQLAEHEGCDCIERTRNGACAEWVRIYSDHLGKLIRRLSEPLTGRG